MAETIEKIPGLTEAEAKQWEKLRAKAAAAAGVHGPEIRVGEPYQALVNLSVPRRGVIAPGEVRQSDLVPAGETVYLTDEEAATFLRHGGRDGRRIPVIRKLHGPDSSSEENAGRIHPSYLSGQVMRPVMPPGGPGESEQPRPDPADASKVIRYETVPETVQPVPGSENLGDIDIKPGTANVGLGTVSGADQDLMAAVKAQTGIGNKRS